MQALREKLTYANVVATLALIIAVAGIPTAVAVTTKVKKNSITSKQIKNGSIKTMDLANGAVSTVKLGNDAVTSAKLAPVQQIFAKSSSGAAGVTCPAGAQLLSGGGFSSAGIYDSSPGGSTWSVGGPGGNNVATALCLAP